MQQEYKRNPTKALLLELCRQYFLVDTLCDIVQEKEKEKELSLSVNEDHFGEMLDVENHESPNSQDDEECMDDFWTAGWWIESDHQEEENIQPLSVNNVDQYESSYEVNPNDWKDFFFMFQDDANPAKEDVSIIEDDSNSPSVEGIKKYSSSYHATDKGFLFMFE